MKQTTARYSLPFILIHWLLTVLILFLLGLGWYLHYVPPVAPLRVFLLEVHTSLGLTSLILVVLQILLRLRRAPPPLPQGYPRWAGHAASTVHLMTYLCLILMPLSGYFAAVLSGSPVRFWGEPTPVPEVRDASLFAFFSAAHNIVALVLAALVVIHIGLVALGIKHGIGTRMLLHAGPPVKAQAPAPAARTVRRLARNLSFFGWISFWFQLALAFICALLLSFATSGRAFSPAARSLGDGMYWAVYAFVFACITVLLAFYCTRVSGKVTATPVVYLGPEKKFAFWFLGAGMLVSLAGILAAFGGVATSIILLIAKTISQPPGIAITDPNKIIRALDAFLVLVNLMLLFTHFVGASTSFWLSNRVAKARRAYGRTRSARTRVVPAPVPGTAPAVPGSDETAAHPGGASETEAVPGRPAASPARPDVPIKGTTQPLRG